MKRTLADVNVEVELTGGVHLKSTEQSYSSWKKKFLRFCDLGDTPATAETYSDRNIAACGWSFCAKSMSEKATCKEISYCRIEFGVAGARVEEYLLF